MSPRNLPLPALAALALLGLVPGARASDVGPAMDSSPVDPLIAEAIAANPELAAARAEYEAARRRISPAGTLDDPMLETGFVNVPVSPLSLDREDMTMTMLGLEQKLPFPGKRGLRQAVAEADAESVRLATGEVRNRVVRDVRVAYEDLSANQESQRIVGRTSAALQQLVSTTQSRFNVGLASQSDVLDAQTELGVLSTELQQLEREERVLQAQLRRLLGRAANDSRIVAAPPRLRGTLAPQAPADALASRPQLQSLRALVERSEKSVALAEREYYPDFDVKLQYGFRQNAPDGMQRDDMVTLTVGVNLPIWRKSRLDPMVEETHWMRTRAQEMLKQGELETQAALDEQVATAAQWRATAATFHDSLIPQAEAAADSAFAAYRVGKVDFATLRQAQMRVFDLSRRHVEATAAHNKAMAEIDLLAGRGVANETN